MQTKFPWKVLFISEHVIKHSHADHLAKGVASCVEALFFLDYTDEFEKAGRIGLKKSLSSIIEKQQIDLVFVNLGSVGIFTPDISLWLRKEYKVKLVYIFPDSEHNFEEQDRYYAQTADLNWVMNPSLEDLFKLYNLPVFQGFGLHLPIILRNQTVMEKSINVSFVGGVYRADRLTLLQQLENDGVKVSAFGIGTKSGRITDELRDEVIRKSKIHLNFTGVENNRLNIFNRIKQNKARNIEVAIHGTFLLTEYAAGIEKILDIEEGAEIFRSYEELLYKIKFYLINDDIREQRARHQQKHSLENNNSKHVAYKLLTELSHLPRHKETFFVDSIFISWLAGELSRHIGFFIGSLNVRAALSELVYLKRIKGISKFKFNNFLRGIIHGFRY